MSVHHRLGTLGLNAPLSRRSLVAGAGAGAVFFSRGRRFAFASQGTKGELNVLFWADQNDHFKSVAEVFTQETGIGVNYEALPSDYLTAQQLLTTRLAAGDSDFDCFFCDDIETAMYGAAGWLEPLDPIIEEFGIDLGDIPPTLLQDVSSWDGVLYRLPWTSDVELFFYRTDYFAEAGVQPPTTWEEIVEVGQALTQGDRFALALAAQKNGVLANDIQHWANQAGGAIDRLDHPGSREAISFYKDLFATHKIAPPSAPEQDYGTNLQGFLDGKHAMWWVWDAFLGALRNDEEFWNDQVLSFSPLPRGPENAETSIGAWGWAVNASSTQKDLAKQWIAFIARPDIMRMLMIRGNTPARTSLWTDPEYQEQAPQLVFRVALGSGETVFRARPINPGVQEIFDAAEQNIHAYLTDQIDLDTAIEQAMDKIGPIVEQYEGQ